MAAGSYGDIAVVLSDEDLRPAVQPLLNYLNTPVTFVITEENPYSIDIFGPDKMKISQGYKNIFFVLRWEDGGPVGKKVSRLLSKETLGRLRDGQGGFIQMNNPFARYQFSLIFTAHDRNSIASVMRRNREKIAEQLEKSIRERIQRRFRHTGLHENLMTRYWQKFEFFLEIPQEYRENQVLPEGFQGIEWTRNAPTRGISLAWRDVENIPAALQDQDWLLAWRQEMGHAMHNEEIVDVGLTWREIEFAGQPCVQLSGSWASLVIDGGGPFFSFFIGDTKRGRLYCLDILVFAPGMEKMPFMREMRAIAETFSLQRPHP